MLDSIRIRPAQPRDADRAAALLYSAYTHTHVTYPLQTPLESGFIDRLQRYFRQDDNRFSSHYIHLAEQDTEVVGLVLDFGGRDEPRLNQAIGPWLEREAEDDSWYVDALAVFGQWEHQGIGTHLLHTAEQRAREHHYPKITLHAAQENTEAIAFYSHLHYHVTKQTLLYQRPHVRMEKTIVQARVP